MKKWFLALLCIVMAGVCLSGCAAGNAVGMSATASPDVTTSASPWTPTNSPQAMATNSPAASMMPGAPGAATNLNGANGAMTPAEADRLAEKIADEVERISEVDDAEVIVHNNRALVAVEFEDQYSAGLDERMKKMIVEAVKKVDENLKEVEVTDDGTLYGQVKGLGERVANVTGLDELADDFGELWNRITGR